MTDQRGQENIQIRVNKEMSLSLKIIAKQQDRSVSSLLRSWIREKIQQDQEIKKYIKGGEEE